MIKVSVIIVSFNTKDILKDCLESLLKFNKSSEYEVIIVDNGSKDGSIELIKSFVKKYKNFQAFYTGKNLGFSKGNNIGIKAAKGEYILCLNSDTVFVENSLKKMVDWMEDNPNVAVSSCKLLNSDKSIQDTGGKFPNLFHVFLWSTFLDDVPFVTELFGSYHPKAYTFKNEKKQDWVKGAFLFAKRKVLEEVDGFDENIFMYCEDVELCFRIKKLGYQVAYTPVTEIIHLGGASGGTEGTILGELSGLLYFYKKHKSQTELKILKIIIKIGFWFRMILFGLFLQRKDARNIYAKAININ